MLLASYFWPKAFFGLLKYYCYLIRGEKIKMLPFFFQVEIVDQLEGTAQLKLKRRLNCEEKKTYQFDIQALSCTGVYSDR